MTIIFILVVSLSMVSALDSEAEVICNYTEAFLVDHLIEDGFRYYEDDIINLVTFINTDSEIEVDISKVKIFLKGFEKQCGRDNPKLYVEKVNGVPYIIRVDPDRDLCKLDIGQKSETSLLFVTVDFDIDWYIPSPRINTGEMSCKSLSFWKWMFKYEREGENTYSFSGVKIWWIITLLISWWIYRFIAKKVRENKKLDKMIKRKMG